MILNLRRCLPVTIIVLFVYLPWVNCIGYWAAESRDIRTKESQEDPEYDDNYRIIVTHGGDIINSTLTADGRFHDITVTIDAFEETFILDLRFNTYLFASTYIEKSITKTGVIYHNINHTESHCYYIGSVRDRAQSTAAVSTCRGIDGFFAIGNVSYNIESRSNYLHGSHTIFRNRGKSNFLYSCGTDNNGLNSNIRSETRLKRSFLWPQDGDKRDKVVEIYVANDNSQFKNKGSDSNAVFERAKNIINIASSSYQPLGIYFVLVGMEVWTDSDKFSIKDSDVDTALGQWYEYRKRSINPYHYNDDAVLLTNVRFFKGVIGKAIIGSICSNQLSGAIVSDLNSQPAFTGSTVAHEVGHNFGLQHDSSECSCIDKGGNCIMYASANSGIPATNWSSCSKEQFDQGFRKGLDICLYDIPQTIYESTASRCGNGIVEAGEQCDCGRSSNKECNSACCNSTTCQLTPSAACASGRCCDISKCQMSNSGTICRSDTNDCDLAEFCDGIHSICPADTYKPDGTNCTVKGDATYCYNGECRSHRSQCELLWGVGTSDSSPTCYSQFNTNGQHYGNCGIKWLPDVTYIPCANSDVMCGKLLCDNGDRSLAYYQNFYLLSTASVGNFKCNSVIFDYGLRIQDPGLVPNGAKCGEGKMCVSQKCVNVSSVQTKQPTCGQSCFETEKCNNLGFCQSLVGPSRVQQGSTDTGLIVGLVILFVIILPLLVLASFCGFRHRQHLKKFYNRKFTFAVNRNKDIPTVSTVSQRMDTQEFFQVGPHSTGTLLPPSRSAPPPPPPTLIQPGRLAPSAPPASRPWQPPSTPRPQLPPAPRLPPSQLGYDNHATDLTSTEQNHQQPMAIRQLRENTQNQITTSGRPKPPTKPSGLQSVPQVGTRPVLPPKPSPVDSGQAAPYS